MASRNGQVHLGFLYPGRAAEDDYPRAAALLGDHVRATVVHTSVGEDAHQVDALLDLGGPARLLEGADQLAGHGAHVAVWACTSGSFVFGREGAARQIEQVAQRMGVPASSTSFAFANAARALGVGRVAVAATYPEDVAALFASFLAGHGVEVVAVGAEDVMTATEVGTFGPDRVAAFVTAGDREEAEAVLVPDTALHTIEVLEELERRLGKPVLTANQVTVWEAMRLAGALERRHGLGVLFETPAT